MGLPKDLTTETIELTKKTSKKPLKNLPWHCSYFKVETLRSAQGITL